nr:hypothetical protein [Prevotella sp.]
MTIKPFIFIAIATLMVASCGKGKRPPKREYDPISLSKPAKGDSAIYGLACDGCTDSVIVLLPNSGGDPITYNITNAKKKGQVFGSPKIGDWLGVIPDPKIKNGARLVVDLDELKGTWTFQVMPKLKNVKLRAHRAIRKKLEAMSDSVKALYMVPREYGFTLGRQSVASPVGMVRQVTIDNDSPVEYPKVKLYTEWHSYNGRLILIQGKYTFQGQVFNKKTIRDTLNLIYMKDDSLVLRNKKRIYSFHRQIDAHSANAKANAAAMKQEQNAKQDLK